MHRIQSDGRIPDSRSDSLGVILPAVNPDYYKLAVVLRFELPQLRKYVDAVDSPIGPEIQEDDFPAQIGQADFSATRMNPVEVVRKLRRPH